MGVAPMRGWTIRDSLELYNVPQWGSGFFDINAKGHVVVCPRGSEGAGVDLLDLVEGLIPEKAGPLLEAGFSLADVSFGAQLSSLRLAKFDIDAGSWPKIRAYSDWILARPSFETAMEKADI